MGPFSYGLSCLYYPFPYSFGSSCYPLPYSFGSSCYLSACVRYTGKHLLKASFFLSVGHGLDGAQGVIVLQKFCVCVVHVTKLGN